MAQSERLRSNLWVAYFSMLLFWGLNAYLEIGKYFRQGTLFARVLDGRPYVNDWAQYYNGAVLARQCLSGKVDIYDPVVQDQGMRALTFPIVPTANVYFQYPPQYFPLSLPFSALPFSQAYFAWCGLALVFILVALWFLVKDIVKSPFSRAFAYTATLGSYPAWLSFEIAQFSIYQFPFTVTFWLLIRSKRFFLAGLVSAFLLVKLQYMPVFILSGLILGRFKYLLGLLLSGSLLAWATIWLVGWKNVCNYPHALAFAETSPLVAAVSPERMQNFRGELTLCLGSESRLVHLLTLAIFACALVVICLLWLRLYPRLAKVMGSSDGFGVCAALSILISIIASPHTHVQEYLTAAAAVIFLYPLTRAGERKGAHRALSILLLAYPFLSWLFFFFMAVFNLLRLQPYFIWALAVLTATAVIIKGMLERSGEEPQSA